ncbi:MAG: site-specific integrase [Muribaculaceae bacterium]|nr:site-specific integrase [Muribaculaceae bacterium]
MNNKAKTIFADFVSQLMSCPRNFEIWKLRVVKDFLESRNAINKKEIKAYISTLGTSGYHSASEVEGLLLGLMPTGKQASEKTKQKADVSMPSSQGLSKELKESVLAFEQWLVREQEFSPNTARSYTHSASHYLSIFPSLTQKDVVTYRQYLLSTGLSHKTINLRMSGLVSYGKFVGRKIEVKRLRCLRALECNNVPSEEEMKRYLEKVKEISRFWYLVSRCLSTTGLRVHELLKITYRDVINGSVILVGKGGKPRRVFFQHKFVDEISEYLRINNISEDDKVCPKTARGVAQQMRTYSVKAGLDGSKFHPHAFRHYFAKQYLKMNPSDIVGLQNLLGHSSIETTSIYLQRSYEEQLRDYHKNVLWE